jgi:hypothetical protein
MRGAPNTLATFMKQGGSAWVFGGGAAAATLIPWDKGGTPREFNDRDGELIPGRFMYDFAHWRSRIEIGPRARSARLNWQYPKFNSQTPSRGYPGEPSYGRLAANAMALTPRQQGLPDDDPPPLRRPDGWYLVEYDAEMLTNPNFIIEDMNGELPGGDLSTLDTIYVSQEAQSLYLDRPIMTYYHGRDFQKMVFGGDTVEMEPARFVFSGFPVWFFSRPQQIALVDFVLQDVWKLQRDPGAPRGAAGSRTQMTRSSRRFGE